MRGVMGKRPSALCCASNVTKFREKNTHFSNGYSSPSGPEKGADGIAPKSPVVGIGARGFGRGKWLARQRRYSGGEGRQETAVTRARQPDKTQGGQTSRASAGGSAAPSGHCLIAPSLPRPINARRSSSLLSLSLGESRDHTMDCWRRTIFISMRRVAHTAAVGWIFTNVRCWLVPSCHSLPCSISFQLGTVTLCRFFRDPQSAVWLGIPSCLGRPTYASASVCVTDIHNLTPII